MVEKRQVWKGGMGSGKDKMELRAASALLHVWTSGDSGAGDEQRDVEV